MLKSSKNVDEFTICSSQVSFSQDKSFNKFGLSLKTNPLTTSRVEKPAERENMRRIKGDIGTVNINECVYIYIYVCACTDGDGGRALTD